jgi:hypothetical protein
MPSGTKPEESLELDQSGQDFWKFAFPALSLLSLALAFAACSDVSGLSPAERVLAVRGFILVLVCVYGAYVWGEHDFGLRLVLLVVPVAAVAAVYLSPAPGPVSGLAAALLYVLVAVCAMLTRDPAADSASRGSGSRRPPFRQGLVHAWAVTGVLLSASRLEPFAHPRPGLPERMIPGPLQEFLYTHVTDIRVLVSVLAGTFLVGSAVSRAMKRDRPRVPDVPRARLAGLRLPGALAVLVRPFLHAVVVVWTIVRVLADVVWKAVAHTAIALARIAREFASLLVQDVLNPWKLATIAAQVVFWLTLIGLVRASGGVSSTLLDYLRGAPDAVPPAALLHLGAGFVVGGAGTGIVVVLVAVLWTGGLEPGLANRAVFCGSIFLLAFAASGILMHLLARTFRELEIVGFSRLGPVAASVLALFALVVMSLLAWEGWKRRTAPEG